MTPHFSVPAALTSSSVAALAAPIMAMAGDGSHRRQQFELFHVSTFPGSAFVDNHLNCAFFVRSAYPPATPYTGAAKRFTFGWFALTQGLRMLQACFAGGLLPCRRGTRKMA